jgi:hypothetical protein
MNPRTSQVLSLLTTHRVPRVPWSAAYHNLPFGAPLGILICLGVVGFAVFAVTEFSKRSLPLSNWLLIIGALVAPVGLAIWIARLLWARMRAALRSTNWVARIADDGLYLNLRLWLNWRLPDAARTVVRIPWPAITEVHEVREEWRVLPKAGVQRGFNAFVAISLASDVDVAELEQAVCAEIHRVLTHPTFPGGVAVWSDVPVFVGLGGCIWVNRIEMSLLRALARRAPRGHRQICQLRVGPEFSFDDPKVHPQQLVALVLRGQWSYAQQVAQFRMGLGYDESVRLIEQLFAPDAA